MEQVRRCTVEDDTPDVQHDNVVTETDDHVDIVLDEQYADSVRVHDSAEQRGELAGLLVVQSRCGLVEE